MISTKKVIILRPERIKDKLSTKFKSDFRFEKNHFGFFTNGFLVLKDVHSINISRIDLIDIYSTKTILPTNTKNTHGKSMKYSFDWYKFKSEEHLLRVKYANGEIKYFSAKEYANNVIWDEFQNITHIVYLDENLSFTKDFSSIVELKYNSATKKKVLLKSFSNDIKALSYILCHDDVTIVILTKQYMKNLSAKNLIKRVRKTKNNILFIFFSNEKNINIEDVEYFDKSDISLLLERLDSIVK